MLASIRLFWKAFRRPAPPGVRRPLRTRRARPGLEVLEDRSVPTVLFTPQFPGTTEVSPPGAHNQSLQSPPVMLIFAGSYWQTAQGQADEQTLTSAAQSIITGPYLSELQQYGSDGKASYYGSWQDGGSTPPLGGGNTPTGSQLLQYVQNEVASHPGQVPPASGNPQQAPLYVVVNDPQDSSSTPGTYGYNQTDGTLHAAYVGASSQSPGGPVDKDGFTQVLSHELAESITSAVAVNDPGSLGQGSQIADNEPESSGIGYTYRLDGNRVQAYWSQQDGAFVVPDGNTQQSLTLTPVWDASANEFTGQYQLAVKGDQGGNVNDQITVGAGTDPARPGGVQVTVDGYTAQFDAGVLRSVNVDTGGGQNVVSVGAVPQGVAVNVSSSGGGGDTVTVGAGGSLKGVAGSVNVSNNTGHTTLVVDGSNDPAQSVGVTDQAVNFQKDAATVHYQGGFVGGDGATHGVTSLTVKAPYTGTGWGNTIAVQSVPTLTGVAVLDNSGDTFVAAPQAAGDVQVAAWDLIFASWDRWGL
jgi:hypothetical protein